MKIDFFYGTTITHPTFAVRIVEEKATFLDVVRSGLWEFWYFFSQAALLAGSITAFEIAFRLI